MATPKAKRAALEGRHRRSGYRQLTRMLRRRLKRLPRQPMTVPSRRNECGSMDFVHDRTMTGALRTLSVLDQCTRQAPVLTAARSMPSERVIRILVQAANFYGLPERIVVYNGPQNTLYVQLLEALGMILQRSSSEPTRD